MRKFNLFNKVEFTEKNTREKTVGCIVGFTTEEEDGCIIDKESGTLVEPDEHAYVLLVSEMSQTESRFEEFMESELSILDAGIFKDRLEAEREDLEEKLEKLNDFNRSDRANEIDPVQKSLLIIQAGSMYTYLECLKERLARL